MDLLTELRQLGVDVDDALIRFMNNEDFYRRKLLKLKDAVDKTDVMSFFDSGDYNTACENAHALKGLMGNFSITPLYEGYTKIVNLIREGKNDEAFEILKNIIPVQEKIINCIEASKK